MTKHAFLDTNILIYALTASGPKADIALQLMEKGAVVSVQVLNEFISVSRRKTDLTWPELRDNLTHAQLLCGKPEPLTFETHEQAIEIAERYRYTIYDANLLASALQAGCTIFYSEDMHNGQQIETLTIRNPFTNPA